MRWTTRRSPRSGSSRGSPPGRSRRARRPARLTPAAKAVLTGIRDARKSRGGGLGIVLSGLLGLPRPDPAAELLAALGVDARAARERFSVYDQEGKK